MGDPLSQRLDVYRFAWLQTDAKPLDADLWRPARLHRLPSNQGETPLDRLALADLPVSSCESPVPVISSQWSVLRRLRKARPRRPLVLLTLMSRKGVRRSRLRTLVSPLAPTLEEIAHEDAIIPLIWAPHNLWAQPKTTAPQLDYNVHPRRRLWQSQARLSPQFSLREDGLVQCQDHLFSSTPELKFDRPRQALFDQAFLRAVAACGSRTYVLAASHGVLNWFQRDVIRLLPPRIQVGPAGCVPHPDDPQPHFLCLTYFQRSRHPMRPEWSRLHLSRTGPWSAVTCVDAPPRWCPRSPRHCDTERRLAKSDISLQWFESGWHLSLT